ncbi:MAG TPA: hypothetical protein VNT52_01380 [Acidimicrobiales bacterium]|nr:hypothetical protein [Acidimicrobiales bacterium]
MAVDPSAPSDEALAAVYSGRALTTRMKDGLPSSSTSMPALMATMLEPRWHSLISRKCPTPFVPWPYDH